MKTCLSNMRPRKASDLGSVLADLTKIYLTVSILTSENRLLDKKENGRCGD